jgi:hypothetical protein
VENSGGCRIACGAKDSFTPGRGVEIAREERVYVIECLPLFWGEDAMNNQDDNNKQNTGAWEKMRIVIGLVLVAAISYQMGLAHARSERNKGEYFALRAQYDKVLTESSALRAQYDRILTEYSASKTQCAETLTEYAALKNQYDRIEARRTSPAINHPRNQP